MPAAKKSGTKSIAMETQKVGNSKDKMTKSLKLKGMYSIDEVKKEDKHIRKMSFAERLKLEEKQERGHSFNQSQFGEKQLTYTVKDTATEKFKKLREKNEQHAKDRKKLGRTSKKLRGKVDRKPLS